MGISLFSLSLFFLRKCPAVKNTHENTQKHADSAYTRERYIFAPPLEAFSNPKVVFIFFLFPPFFFFTEKRKEIRIMKYEFCLRKLFLRSDEFVTPPPPLRAAEAVGSSSHGLCAGDERNAFKCAL